MSISDIGVRGVSLELQSPYFVDGRSKDEESTLRRGGVGRGVNGSPIPSPVSAPAKRDFFVGVPSAFGVDDDLVDLIRREGVVSGVGGIPALRFRGVRGVVGSGVSNAGFVR